MGVSNAEFSRRMDRFQAACRRAGLKVTHQRTEVFRELAGTDDHPDAETLLAGVRQRVPAISPDTVYRTLATLEAHGLVRKVDVAGDRTRYDADVGRHHHLVCTVCGAIEDFRSRAVDNVRWPPSVRDWGDIECVQVQLRGVCRRCRAAAREGEPRE